MTSQTGPDLAKLRRQLVVAYRIFADKGVLDIEGHLSFRHPGNPELYVMGKHAPAATITEADLLTVNFKGDVLNEAGEVIGGTGMAPGERLIHAAVYMARPDVNAVCHSHTPEFIAYSISDVPLRPVYQWAGLMGYQVPVWDSAAEFGDTAMSLGNLEMSQSAARGLADGRTLLVRGHGAIFAAASLPQLALLSVYALENAQLLATAHSLGGKIHYLSEGETKLCETILAVAARTVRPWQAWSAALGVPDDG